MSKHYNKVKKWYDMGMWGTEAVKNAVKKAGLQKTNTKKSQVMTMTLDEIIETQSEIIDLQNQLIRNLAAGFNVDLAYNAEMKRIEELKEKVS